MLAELAEREAIDEFFYQRQFAVKDNVNNEKEYI